MPLTPKHVFDLKSLHQIQTIIQPSAIRVYSDDEYAKAGALVQEDLSSCSVIFGVKEMPISFFQPGKAYMFFSHTIKGQKQNMEMLKHLMKLGSHLLDYEKVVDATGRRILFFGRYAGIAGMIDTLWALGSRLDWEGIHTPFSSLKPTHEYKSLTEAKEAVLDVGRRIKTYGLNTLHPLVVGFAGYGNVSRGAQEIFNLLPHREMPASQLFNREALKKGHPAELIKVVFHEEDMMEPVNQGSLFDLQDYYDHPEKYRSRFEHYLPLLTVLINAIFWRPQYPRLVTKASLRHLFESDASTRLRVIGDITCDTEGSIECNLQSTQPDHPVYVYDPFEQTIQFGVEGAGPVILAVDNLPCELPRASSKYFGNALYPYVREITQADFRASFESCCLSREIQNAVILYQGKLTPAFQYLESYLT